MSKMEERGSGVVLDRETVAILNQHHDTKLKYTLKEVIYYPHISMGMAWTEKNDPKDPVYVPKKVLVGRPYLEGLRSRVPELNARLLYIEMGGRDL